MRTAVGGRWALVRTRQRGLSTFCPEALWKRASGPSY